MKAKGFYKKHSEKNYSLLYDWKKEKDISVEDFVSKCSEPSKEYLYRDNCQQLILLFRYKYSFELGTRSSKRQNSIIGQIEKSANNRNYQAFNSLIKNVNLSNLQADEIIKIINLSLSLDMIPLALDLATKAKELYPEHEKIHSAYNALSPPNIIGTRSPQATGIEKSQKWFRENAFHHKGKWVAINNGNLLAEADSLKELKTKIDEKYINPSTVIEKIF